VSTIDSALLGLPTSCHERVVDLLRPTISGSTHSVMAAPTGAIASRQEHVPIREAAALPSWTTRSERRETLPQLGHSNLGITSVYLQGIDNAEIIDAVHARRAPMIPVSA
jgi:hypothetical protein